MNSQQEDVVVGKPYESKEFLREYEDDRTRSWLTKVIMFCFVVALFIALCIAIFDKSWNVLAVTWSVVAPPLTAILTYYYLTKKDKHIG